MKITAIKTDKIGIQTHSLESILTAALPSTLSEKSIVVVSSKIVSLCQGRTLPLESISKEELIAQESDYYLPKEKRLHGNCTITCNAFIGSAGVDESNGAGHYVLLPDNIQAEARHLQKFLQNHYQVEDVGVMITDSHSTPLRRGAIGITLAYVGFSGLKDYRGTRDLFGRELKVEMANQVDALATAAVFAMGEGNEQTPLILIEHLPDHFSFSEAAPLPEELANFFVPLEDDIFYPLIRHEILKPGKKK